MTSLYHSFLRAKELSSHYPLVSNLSIFMIVYNKLIIKQLLTTCVVDLQLASKRIVICVKLRAEVTQVTV